MRVRKAFWVAGLAAMAAWLPVRTTYAGFQYQSTIAEDDQNKSDTHLGKPGTSKLVMKPSAKAGDGGATIQLVMKKMTCTKCSNNVLELNVRALGNDLPSASIPFSAAGILFNIDSKGTALFPNGKNTSGFGSTFGVLASAIFNKPLGIGVLKFRTTASDPTKCNQAPLIQPGCNDGDVYAFTGIVVPVDPSATCNHDDTKCSLTQVCDSTTNLCAAQTCVDPSECRSGHCNINSGQCCDPAISTDCP